MNYNISYHNTARMIITYIFTTMGQFRSQEIVLTKRLNINFWVSKKDSKDYSISGVNNLNYSLILHKGKVSHFSIFS